MNITPSTIFNFLRNQGRRGPPAGDDEPNPEGEPLPAARRQSLDAAFGRIAPRPILPAAYETPDPSGRCWLIELPEELLVKVFSALDRVSLARCMRVCGTIHDLLTTNPHLALQTLLSFSSLRLNPNALIPSQTNLHLSPPSPAELLARLRDRLDRFDRLDPTRTTSMRMQETEGSLYEYLEGILLKSVGGSRGRPTNTIGIYDVRGVGAVQAALAPPPSGPTEGSISIPLDDQVFEEEDGEDDWEEMEDGDEVAEKIRRSKKFDFGVSEFAVDPGQDLIVLVEVKLRSARQYVILFHLLSLETLEPHPLARQQVLEWPIVHSRKEVSLGFQICDDGMFVLNHNIRSGQYDQICGWQWTSGRLAVTLKAFPTMTFESFILLSPTSLLVPTIITHLDPESTTQEDLNNPSDLSWTHHLHLYAFPSLASISLPDDSSEPFPPPHAVTHITTFDLPEFVVDLTDEMPPPRMTIRTDPPPRHTFPTHPADSVQPFSPHPESGVIIIEFFCQMPAGRMPHYVMACQKRTFIQYLPAPTSPLLKQAWPRQAPVVKWETISPKVRMFGPDMKSSNWVCYVYQDRYVASTSSRRNSHDPLDFNAKIRLYDFNPLRVKREALRRKHALPPSTASSSATVPISSPSLKRRFSLLSSSSPPTPPIAPANASAEIDGEERGVTLITGETVLRNILPLAYEVRTGSEFPYTFVEMVGQAEVLLLDDERLTAVYTPDLDGHAGDAKSRIEVMEF